MVEYNNLESLIFQNADARQFYNELPDFVRAQMSFNSGEINSYESLIVFAENLLLDND